MRVESDQLREFAVDLVNAESGAKKLMRNTSIRIATIMEAHLKEKAPKFQGNLVNSLRGRAKTSGKANTALVSSSLPYARIQDEGRRPGKMPPHDPIRRWVELKLFKRAGILADDMGQSIDDITYLIRRAIGKKGTKATQFIIRGMKAAQPQIEQELKLLEADMVRLVEQ